ncbi:hypothetical protein [Gemmata sp.]|uniref:hypothetical protein n=1 Tax=Gemmata sp. TaxID=1914242 RepID=UPI003F704666
MRVTFGIASVVGFGLSVTVALGQGPGQRGAKLLAPRAADPEEGRVQVRAAAEPLPQFPGSTPVGPPQGKGHAATPPAGFDPNVRSAGTVTPEKGAPRTAPTRDEPSLVTRGLDKIKSTFTSAPPAAAAASNGPDPANPNAPFRGTSPTGQTVYAGPPAYRWYGWGSVTPGANPYAPTGQFPRASANWYAITGATPGAFPTQVTDPYRLGTGTEPPAYVSPAAPPPPPPSTIYSPQPVQYRQPQPAPGPVVPRASAVPAGPAAPRTLTVPEGYVPPPPTLTPIPSVGAAVPVPTMSPTPVPAATVAMTPLPVAETEPAGSRVVTTQPLTLAPMLPRGGDQPPSLAAIPTIPTLPVLGTMTPAPVVAAPATVVAPPAPAPLPISVTADEPRWQPTPTVPAPTTVDWNPAGGKR